MCWVAVDRAIRLASKRSLPAPFARWDQTRQAIYADIWENFWNEEHGHFVQYKGGTALDGSMLLMPLVRFVSAKDPRWLATLKAIEKTLVRDGMVYRYRNDDSQIDGLAGTEGAFAACSFWYVECLARAGQVDKLIWSLSNCCATPTRWGCMPRSSTVMRGIWGIRRKR